MATIIRTAIVLFSLVLIGACARISGVSPGEESESPEAVVYTWSSFFNDGCGRAMDICLRDDDSGRLYYDCPSGEPRTQALQRHPDQMLHIHIFYLLSLREIHPEPHPGSLIQQTTDN